MLRAFGGNHPESAICPRSMLIVWVRCALSGSRTRCTAAIAWSASLLIGTKRIDGRLTASQIASASAGSVFVPPHMIGAVAGTMATEGIRHLERRSHTPRDQLTTG
jgi:hypothetical protein